MRPKQDEIAVFLSYSDVIIKTSGNMFELIT